MPGAATPRVPPGGAVGPSRPLESGVRPRDGPRPRKRTKPEPGPQRLTLISAGVILRLVGRGLTVAARESASAMSGRSVGSAAAARISSSFSARREGTVSATGTRAPGPGGAAVPSRGRQLQPHTPQGALPMEPRPRPPASPSSGTVQVTRGPHAWKHWLSTGEGTGWHSLSRAQGLPECVFSVPFTSRWHEALQPRPRCSRTDPEVQQAPEKT